MKKLDYMPLIDDSSAFQNGLLDAMNGRADLSPVLLVAEELVLAQGYSMGYIAGGNLRLTDMPSEWGETWKME